MITLIGIAVGIPSGIGLSHMIAGMVFGVSLSDWPTLASASIFLLLIALLAGYIPARRASRLDPMVALRTE